MTPGHWRSLCLLVAAGSWGCGASQAAPTPARVQSKMATEPQTEPPEPEHARPAVVFLEKPPAQGDSVVRFSFETTTAAAVAGGTFWLAARFELPAGYRVFWVNPGAEGRPTRIQFRGPEGFEISDVHFPPPRKFQLGDSGVAYGYQGETAAFAQVRAIPDLHAGETYRFEVEASWLACEERCYPESAAAYVELGVSDSAEPRELPGELAHLLDQLPKPLTDLAGVSYRWRRGGRLHVTAADTEWVDFLPEHPLDPKLAEVATDEKKSTLKLRFDDGTPGSRVQGLGVVNSGGAHSYVRVDIPWPVPARP